MITHGEFEALEPAMAFGGEVTASKVAIDYKYNAATRALYLKDGTFIADVMGTDPDPDNPAGPTWIGFDSDGNRRTWKASDIDRIHDVEYTLQTSWVDEQMDKQSK